MAFSAHKNVEHFSLDLAKKYMLVWLSDKRVLELKLLKLNLLN